MGGSNHGKLWGGGLLCGAADKGLFAQGRDIGTTLGSDGVTNREGEGMKQEEEPQRELLEGRLPLGSDPEPRLKTRTCVNRRLPMVLTV